LDCKICKKPSSKIFCRKILDKYDIDYFQCSSCGFIQTEEPYWLEEAYKHTFNIEDTGMLSRNILSAKRSTAILFSFFDKYGFFVDAGGGTGLFVRMMRDYGFDFYWEDPYAENIFARGFDYDKNKHTKIEIVTSFECFEHFADPMKEIERMLSISPSILFSTVPFVSGTPDPKTWDYYMFESGQHISLYSLASLESIAKKYHLNLNTNRKSFHLLTPKYINNNVFNFLVKASYLTMPALIKPWLKSRTIADSKQVAR
jgi:hypothetical protein